VEFLGIGLPELLVILILTLIVVGPNRLPEMAAQMARFIRAARRYGNTVTKDFNEALHDLEQEYDDMKGEWKEVSEGLDKTAKDMTKELKEAGEGLEKTAKDVTKELKAADEEVRKAAGEASSAVEDAAKPPKPPTPSS
jgi:sec-independent protein translocase protein TatB